MKNAEENKGLEILGAAGTVSIERIQFTGGLRWCSLRPCCSPIHPSLHLHLRQLFLKTMPRSKHA